MSSLQVRYKAVGQAQPSVYYGPWSVKPDRRKLLEDGPLVMNRVEDTGS